MKEEKLRQLIREEYIGTPDDSEFIERLASRIDNEFIVNDEPPSPTVIEAMEGELEDIKDALNRLEEQGFSLELMEIFIYKKTNVNLTEIRKVLKSQRNFLNEAFKPVGE